MNEKPHVVDAALVALCIIAIYIPAITITAEFVPPLKAWLAATYGHHWVGKGIIMMIVYGVVFVLSYFGLKAKGKQLSAELVKISTILSVISACVITLFFLYEYVIHL